jgi:hypothetical protein
MPAWQFFTAGEKGVHQGLAGDVRGEDEFGTGSYPASSRWAT